MSSTALSLLQASTTTTAAGASASAQVTSTGGRGHDTGALIGLYGETLAEDRARLDQVLDEARTRDRDSSRAEITARRVAHLKEKTAAYQAALSKLTEGRGSGAVMLVAAQGQTGVSIAVSAPIISALHTGAGHDAVSAQGAHIDSVYTHAGHDAVALHGGSVNSVYSGQGNDAVAIAAERVEQVYSGPGTDAVAIRADRIGSVYTGQGNDAIALEADLIRSVYAGQGADAISLSAGIVGGIYGGQGADAITVNARLGASVARRLVEQGGADQAAQLTGEASTRYRAVLSNIADVSGGQGADAITVAGAEAINIAGEAGDDLISVSGRTIGLHYGLGDGHDVVNIGAGTDIVLQLGARADGTAAPEDYTVTRSGDVMRVDFGSGSITFTGMTTAGTVALMSSPGATPQVLNSGIPVDLTV